MEEGTRADLGAGMSIGKCEHLCGHTVDTKYPA